MKTHATTCCFVLALALVSIARATIEGPYVLPEPWSGYWWPWYCSAPGSCPNCPHHLWYGPPITEGGTGPIYDLDTRYFWKPVAERYLAQEWEKKNHYTNNPLNMNAGHCNGASCASILEPEPPDVPGLTGPLSCDDLKGLLAEIYYDCWTEFTFGPNLSPGAFWKACRTFMRPGPEPERLVVDFATGMDVSDYAVYGYRVTYEVSPDDGTASGTFAVNYEDHVLGQHFAPRQASYDFRDVPFGHGEPEHGGTWGNCTSPTRTPPDIVYVPSEVKDEPVQRNPYISYKEVRRVIDHLTIVVDDPWAYWGWPELPPGAEWESRDGYGGNCWAGPGDLHQGSGPYYGLKWSLALDTSGLWSYFVYKTPPTSDDVLDEHALVVLYATGAIERLYYDQAAGPHGVWQHLTDWLIEGSGPHHVSLIVHGFDASPVPCLVYCDA